MGRGRMPDRGCDNVMTDVGWVADAKEPVPPTSDVEPDHEHDLVVVGGGFLGLTTALFAAERGLDVALFEAGTVGSGASGRNGGIVVPHFPGAIRISDVAGLLGERKAHRLAELVATGPQAMFDRIRNHQIACDAEQNGWVQPAHSERALRRIRAVYDEWKAFGAPVEWLSGDDVETALGTSGHLGGWLNRTGGFINPTALCRGLARAATARGARVCEYASVRGVERADGRLAVTVGAVRVFARKVFIATNGYTPSTWPALSRSVVPLRLFHTLTQPLDDDAAARILPTRMCFTDLRRSGGFGRYDAQNRLMSGGAVFALGNARRSGAAHARRRMTELYPALPPVEIAHYWEGYCGLAPSYLPAFSVLDDNVFALIGFSTRGIALSQQLGRLAAKFLADDLALDDIPLAVGPPRPVPLQALKASASRFVFPYYRALDRWGRT